MTLRLIDANLDRLGEGLRVLEDVARFHLDDGPLSERLKNLRHEMVTVSPALKENLLASRNSESDVGRQRIAPTGSERRKVVDLVTANAKRAQESLRVLEECAKLPEMPPELQKREFERARFDLYHIEKELSLKLSRKDTQAQIAGLHVIIDVQSMAGRQAIDIARQAIAGGANVLQFRDKISDKSDIVSVAREIREICAQADVLFLINDHVDVAMAVDADGVHLGPHDLPVKTARALLPPHKIIGCSARTVEKALKAQNDNADYVGVGSVYATATKPNAPVIGPEGLRSIKGAVSLPVVAIGGINAHNVSQVMETGADGVAVISAVMTSNIAASTQELIAAISERKANEPN